MSHFEQAFQDFSASFDQVGRDLFAAMQEISLERGGEEFAAQVYNTSESGGVLPNPAALKLIEDHYPGAGQDVLDRLEKISEERRGQEVRALEGGGIRRYGRMLLAGFRSIGEGAATFSIFPPDSKK